MPGNEVSKQKFI